MWLYLKLEIKLCAVESASGDSKTLVLFAVQGLLKKKTRFLAIGGMIFPRNVEVIILFCDVFFSAYKTVW